MVKQLHLHHKQCNNRIQFFLLFPFEYCLLCAKKEFISRSIKVKYTSEILKRSFHSRYSIRYLYDNSQEASVFYLHKNVINGANIVSDRQKKHRSIEVPKGFCLQEGIVYRFLSQLKQEIEKDEYFY